MSDWDALAAPCDFHVHTSRSWDSSAGMSLETIRARALESGIGCVGLSDHLWLDRKGRWRPSPSRLLSMHRDISVLPPVPRFLVGAEIDCLSPVFSLRLRETDGLDFVIVADHLADLRTGTFTFPADPAKTAFRLLDGFRASAGHPLCRIVGHPFYFPAPLLSRADEFRPEYAAEVYSLVAERAAEFSPRALSREVAVELNARALGPQLRPLLLPAFRAIREAGFRFTLGSDAHSPGEIGATLSLESYSKEIGIKGGELLTADELLR